MILTFTLIHCQKWRVVAEQQKIAGHQQATDKLQSRKSAAAPTIRASPISTSLNFISREVSTATIQQILIL